MPGSGTKTAITSAKGDRASLLLRYRRRLIRKKYLWKAFRKRHELRLVSDQLSRIGATDILVVCTVRNEALRLPFFLEHYRRLGVGHFLMIDNGSEDGTAELLMAQPDVTLWHSTGGYRASRFGVDWQNWLLRRYVSGHWALVVDADEILIYPDWEKRDLKALTTWLNARGHVAMEAPMLDLYPKGPLGAQSYVPGQDPMEVLTWFDAYGSWAQRQSKLDTLWMQGGARARYFFADQPLRAPTMNKTPLVRWRKGYAFVNSTHSALPSFLNHAWQAGVSGVLLHTKFLPEAPERARIEKARDEHFWNGALYADYYDGLANSPDLWTETSQRYIGWEDLVRLGVMFGGDWLAER